MMDKDKDKLIQAIEMGDPCEIAREVARVLANDDAALDEIAMAYLAKVEEYSAPDEKTQLQEQVQALEWFVSTMVDVFRYNEYSIIPLDLVEKWLMAAESADTFTKETYQKIHLEIIEAGLVTLPTSNKAIQRYGEGE